MGIKITKQQLRRIIKEIDWSNHIDGQPFPGSMEELAKLHSKAWGHGDVVDPKAWNNSVKLGQQYTQGIAPGPLKTGKVYLQESNRYKVMKITKRQLRRIIKEEKDKVLESAYQPVSTAFQNIYDGMLDAFYQSVEALGTHDQGAVSRLKAEIQQRGLDFKGDAEDYLSEFDEGPSYRDPLDPGDTI